MARKILSFLLTCALLLTLTTAVGAAEIDTAVTGAAADAAIVAADYPEVGSVLEPTGALPSSYSSLALGYTTPVRRQIYNTCWAYCSTATLETLLIKNLQSPMHLSTMHMNYWGTTATNGNGWQRAYTDGGYPYIALGYFTSFGCVPDAKFGDTKTLSDYRALQNTLYPYKSVDSAIYLDGTDHDTIKTAIYTYGGAVGNFHYVSDFVSQSGAAYYCDTPGLSTEQLAGHAVELVGWDDNYSVSNFNSNHRPAKKGAWLCKNSWGESSGEKGYIWISYEDEYLFDSRFGPSYSLVGYSDMTAINKIQQNEIYGATYEFDYVQQVRPQAQKMTYANVFDFSDGYHNIDKVVFESTSDGSKYTVYYIPVDSKGVPVSDTGRWVELAKGTIEYQGYISANIDGFDAPKGKGAIGVQVEKTDVYGGITIGSAEWLSGPNDYIFLPDAQYGQSYILGYSTQPTDVMDFYKTWLFDDIGGTFVIKALCRSDEVEGDVDSNGILSILDATHVQRYLSKMEEFTDVQLRFADYDNNGEVEIGDSTKIQRTLSRL